MTIWTKKSELNCKQKRDEKNSIPTFSAFLKDIFQLITIMGVFGAITIYLNTSMGFFNQTKAFNLGIVSNFNDYINPNNIFYSNGLMSFGEIILSIGIAASLWIFCIIAFTILIQSGNIKYRNKIDSYSNTLFIFSLSVLTLVVAIMILKQFINLYLFYVVMMSSTALDWLKDAYTKRTGLKIKAWGINKLYMYYIISNILKSLGVISILLFITIDLFFKIQENYVFATMAIGILCMISAPIIDKALNKKLNSLNNIKICTDFRADCVHRGPNQECNMKDKAL